MFLDDTACNLASLNLIQFRIRRRARLTSKPTSTPPPLDCRARNLRCHGAVPVEGNCRLSYEYRTLGLGFANIGGLLMTSGIPYDSKEGRAICGALSAIMTGVAYATSAEMASELGAFPGLCPQRRDNMLRVMRNHRRAAHGETQGYEKLSVNPVPL